jgi:hypothetical protein
MAQDANANRTNHSNKEVVMRTRAQHIDLITSVDHRNNQRAGEFAIPRINRLTPAMLLIMLSMAVCGVYVGYHITHGIFVSLVFGGVFGRIGMWLGMISCGLVAGIEDFLQNIFK